MSRAVNMCVIIIIYQSAEGSQRTKLGIVFNVIAITLYKLDSFKIVVLEVQRPQKGENCIFSQNASANHLYLTVICFILWHTSNRMCSESCYIKLLLNLSCIRSTKRPWKARGWGISDIKSTGIVWLRCVLYRQQYVLPKCKSLLKLKSSVGHVLCNWISIALHSVLVLVENPTSPTTTTEWSKDDSTMQHAKGAAK